MRAHAEGPLLLLMSCSVNGGSTLIGRHQCQVCPSKALWRVIGERTARLRVVKCIFVYGKTVQSCWLWYNACIVFFFSLLRIMMKSREFNGISIRFKDSMGLGCRQNTLPTFYTFCIQMLTPSEVFAAFGWVLIDIRTAGNRGWTLNLLSTQPALAKLSPHLYLCYL